MPDTGWRSTRRVARLLVVAGLLAACSATVSVPGTGANNDERRVVILRSFEDQHHLAFTDELRTLGWRPGRDVSFLPQRTSEILEDAEGARSFLRAASGEAGPPDLVVAFSTPFAQLAREELPATPTLFVVNDPVASGLIEDPQQPEGMLTGLTFRTPADRTLDLAIRVIGGIERLGYLVPESDVAVVGHRAGVLEAAGELDIEVVEVTYDDPAGVAAAVERLAAAEVDAVWLANSNAVLHALEELEEHLVAHQLPAIANTEHPTFAVVVVTPDGKELRRQLARQASRLLAGTPVSSVPVEDPRRFLVTINQTIVEEEFGLPAVDAGLLRQADLVR